MIEEKVGTQGRFLPLLIFGLIAGSAIVLADGASGTGAVSITNSAPILQNFDTLSNSTTPSNALPAGWYLTEIGTGAAADGSYVVGTGSSNAGGAYSFGAAGSTDRALGSMGSGTVYARPFWSEIYQQQLRTRYCLLPPKSFADPAPNREGGILATYSANQFPPNTTKL